MQNDRPHVVGDYYAVPNEKQSFLRGIFDRTARYYDRIGFWGWLGTGPAYRRSALLRAGFKPHMRALDVASGTGPVAKALIGLAKSADQIECVEPSAGMIAESRKALLCVHHQATAEAMPVADADFDFLTMGFALRHVDDLSATFREFHRVLKPGGKVLILELTKPRSAIGGFFFRLQFKHILPRLSYLITLDAEAFRLMRYYWDSMDQMVEPEAVTDLLANAGFTAVSRRLMIGMCSEYEATR